MNLRKLAREQPCQLRIPGCNGDPMTTVLAHVKRGGVGAMSGKPTDLCAILACSYCHDVFDGRMKTEFSRVELDAMGLHGLARTLEHWRHLGVID